MLRRQSQDSKDEKQSTETLPVTLAHASEQLAKFTDAKYMSIKLFIIEQLAQLEHLTGLLDASLNQEEKKRVEEKLTKLVGIVTDQLRKDIALNIDQLFNDVLHNIALDLARKYPINNVDPCSQETMDEIQVKQNIIYTSDRYWFDLAQLAQWIQAKGFINPCTRQEFSERDRAAIKKLAKDREIELIVVQRRRRPADLTDLDRQVIERLRAEDKHQNEHRLISEERLGILIDFFNQMHREPNARLLWQPGLFARPNNNQGRLEPQNNHGVDATNVSDEEVLPSSRLGHQQREGG